MADEKPEVHEDPFSTWGASEPYKAAWNEQHGSDGAKEGKPAPSQSLSEAEAKEAGLVEAGAGAEGNVASDPAKSTADSPAASVASTTPVSSSGGVTGSGTSRY